ncbi:hypothetical protein Kisp01_72070 [Kineosporia sp. NBRC 101677]|nr:hypothetical protein Kisp01_72070 [Kineosporia sp. NBRC 101677]
MGAGPDIQTEVRRPAGVDGVLSVLDEVLAVPARPRPALPEQRSSLWIGAAGLCMAQVVLDWLALGTRATSCGICQMVTER